MSNIKKSQDDLLDTIHLIVKGFAHHEFDEAIKKEGRPISVDEACEYITTLSDSPETWDKVEKIFKAVITEKWEEYLSLHQQNWSDDKAKELTEKSLRNV